MTQQAIRESVCAVFTDPPADAHVGLLLDRGLPGQEDKVAQLYKKHFALVAQRTVPAIYTQFYARWQQTLQELGAHAVEGKVRNRLIVGIGAASALENSITLHRNYGVPLIPGSALKGLVAAYARQQLANDAWRKEGAHYLALFGSPENVGAITFFDALYVPGSVSNNKPLVPDVITVHHQDYYRDAKVPPADWDDPVPVPLLSATGSYLFALRADDINAARAAFAILRFALDEAGVGAKTSSGYGRITIKEEAIEKSFEPPVDPQQGAVDDLIKRAQQLRGNAINNSIGNLINELNALGLPAALYRQAASAIVTHLQRNDKEKWARSRAWYPQLLSAVEGE
jgi:CRISPR-associated protein Cmr6